MKRSLSEAEGTNHEQSSPKKSAKIVTTTAFPFSSETLANIQSYLDDATSVVRVSMVSKSWNDACFEYQEMIWKSVCANCLNNLEKYPFMKTVTGEKFDIQAYEGIYSSWKETFVKMFYCQLKRFTLQYETHLNTTFQDAADNKDKIMQAIKKHSTLIVPYTFPHQIKDDGDEEKEDEDDEEEKEDNDDDEEENEEKENDQEQIEDNTPIGSSKIGGLPDLPKGMKWPINLVEEDKLLKFVCQVNLSDLKNYHCIKGILPSCGWLFCFIDWENDEDDDYKENRMSFYWNGSIDMLERCAIPEEGLEYEKSKAVPIHFKDELVQPMSDRVAMDLEVEESYRKASDCCPSTAIMGYPNAIQCDDEMISDDRFYIFNYQHSSHKGNVVDTSDSCFYWMLPTDSCTKIKYIKKEEEQIRAPLFTTFQC